MLNSHFWIFQFSVSIFSEKTNTAFFLVEYRTTLHFSLVLTVELVFVEFLHSSTSEQKAQIFK